LEISLLKLDWELIVNGDKKLDTKAIHQVDFHTVFISQGKEFSRLSAGEDQVLILGQQNAIHKANDSKQHKCQLSNDENDIKKKAERKQHNESSDHQKEAAA